MLDDRGLRLAEDIVHEHRFLFGDPKGTIDARTEHALLALKEARDEYRATVVRPWAKDGGVIPSSRSVD